MSDNARMETSVLSAPAGGQNGHAWRSCIVYVWKKYVQFLIMGSLKFGHRIAHDGRISDLIFGHMWVDLYSVRWVSKTDIGTWRTSKTYDKFTFQVIYQLHYLYLRYCTSILHLYEIITWYSAERCIFLWVHILHLYRPCPDRTRTTYHVWRTYGYPA